MQHNFETPAAHLCFFPHILLARKITWRADEGVQGADPLIPKRILHFSRLRRVCFFRAKCMWGKDLSQFFNNGAKRE